MKDKRKKKIVNPTVEEKKIPSETSQLKPEDMSTAQDLITLAGTLDRVPYNEKMRRMVLQQATEAAQSDPEVLSLEDFLARKNFYRSTWRDWVERDAWFKEGHEHIKMILAAKRDSGAIRNKYNPVAAYKRIHQLEPNPDVWKQIYEDNKKVQENANKPTNIVIEMKETPSVLPEVKE